jgi:hypothetical protein
LKRATVSKTDSHSMSDTTLKTNPLPHLASPALITSTSPSADLAPGKSTTATPVSFDYKDIERFFCDTEDMRALYRSLSWTATA